MAATATITPMRKMMIRVPAPRDASAALVAARTRRSAQQAALTHDAGPAKALVCVTRKR